jgi:Glyoxalase/Bleomycin resistance protein/Dioxygenase superfamily
LRSVSSASLEGDITSTMIVGSAMTGVGRSIDTGPLRAIVEQWSIQDGGESLMALRINVTSVMVDDQRKALEFYTGVLGFVKKTEIPMGEVSWLTEVSPDARDGVELVLEPDSHPAAVRSRGRWWRTGSPSPRSRWTT